MLYIAEKKKIGRVGGERPSQKIIILLQPPGNYIYKGPYIVQLFSLFLGSRWSTTRS